MPVAHAAALNLLWSVAAVAVPADLPSADAGPRFIVADPLIQGVDPDWAVVGLAKLRTSAAPAPDHVGALHDPARSRRPAVTRAPPLLIRGYGERLREGTLPMPLRIARQSNAGDAPDPRRRRDAAAGVGPRRAPQVAGHGERPHLGFLVAGSEHIQGDLES